METNLIDVDDLLGACSIAADSNGHTPSQNGGRQQAEGSKPAAADQLLDLPSSTAEEPRAPCAAPTVLNDSTVVTVVEQGSGPCAACREEQQEQPILAAQRTEQRQHQEQPQSEPDGACNSVRPSLLPVCERVASLGQLLQQHGTAQGEANASIRLLLATISAKQVKTRQLLAGISASQHLPHSQEQQQQQQHSDQRLHQQLQQMQQQLAASQSELAATRAELAQLKAQQAQQAEVLLLRAAELSELREAEQGYQTEISGLQEKLLDAEAALSRLSASLPGGSSTRRRSDGSDAGTADDLLEVAGLQHAGLEGSTAAQAGQAAYNSVAAAAAGDGKGRVSPFVAAANAAAAAAGPAGDGSSREPAFVTPVRPGKQHSHRGSLLTPDQQNIQQLKNWLHESQSALMKAQEDLLDSEALVKQLTQQLEQQGQEQQGQLQVQSSQEQLELQRQHESLQELQEALTAAEAAAEATSSDRDALMRELSELKTELSKLRAELQEAKAAQEAAVLKLQAAENAAAEQQQDQVQQHATLSVGIDAGSGTAAAVAAAEQEAAAAARTAAEAELSEARAAAATAAAEVAALQEQLKQLQGQQAAAAEVCKGPLRAAEVAGDHHQHGVGEATQGPDTPFQQLAGTDARATAQATTGGTVAGQVAGDQQHEQQQHEQQGEGSIGYQLLLATSQRQVLQAELADTKQRLLLLLQLVKKAAAAAGYTSKQRLPAELAGLLDSDASKDCSNGAAAALAEGDDVEALMALVAGLEQRYCRTEQLQNVLLRGREMLCLLENARQQVHQLKDAIGTKCACPSELEYEQLAAAMRGDIAAAAAAVPAAAGQAEDAAPATGVRAETAAATAGSLRGVGDMLIDHPLHDGVGAGQLDAASYVTRLPGVDAYSPQQHQHGAAGAPPYIGSSCSSDVLRVGAASSSAAGLAVVDEGLSYDGLEGAWWNQSSVSSITQDDLPDFLRKA